MGGGLKPSNQRACGGRRTAWGSRGHTSAAELAQTQRVVLGLLLPVCSSWAAHVAQHAPWAHELIRPSHHVQSAQSALLPPARKQSCSHYSTHGLGAEQHEQLQVLMQPWPILRHAYVSGA